MNILFLANHLNIGGISSYLLTLSSGLRERKHNVYVASSGGDLLTRFLEHGITYLRIPIRTKQELSPKIILSAFKLMSIVKQNRIDIIHSNSRTTQVLGCLLSRLTGVVHVSTCHGFFKAKLSRRMFGCWGKKVIAISLQVKEHLINDLNVEENTVEIIHSGINAGSFATNNLELKNEFRKKFGLKEGPVIGIVARLSEEKGHIYLISAMKGVLETFPQAQLLIVGNGKMIHSLLGLTKDLGLENKVIFHPAVNDTRQALSAMDIFVLPSLKEGLGLALIEAMAQGLCVIGSSVGGIKSLISHGYNGILVNPGEELALSQAIAELLRDSDKIKHLGENAREYVYKNFSQERMVLETERVYSACLARK
jgi:L-malate glycosyltransferase